MTSGICQWQSNNRSVRQRSRLSLRNVLPASRGPLLLCSAKNRPIHVRSKILASNFPGCRSFNVWTSLCRNLSSASSPLTNKNWIDAYIRSERYRRFLFKIISKVHACIINESLLVVNSETLYRKPQELSYIVNMRTCDEIRRDNLTILIREYGGIDKLAEKYDCTPAESEIQSPEN